MVPTFKATGRAVCPLSFGVLCVQFGELPSLNVLYNPFREVTPNCPIFLNNTSCEYSYNNFTVGGAFTKWSFFDACNVLRDRTASDYLPMFNGAHAIFGFQSNNFYWSWKSDWWQCTWYGCDYTNNWDQETYFFNNWFSGQNMWTAYSNAITQNYNHANTSYFHGNISGYEYATVQITGQALDNNGNWQTVSGAYESITNTFKNQMPTYTVGPGWNYQGISYISTVIGTPVYN